MSEPIASGRPGQRLGHVVLEQLKERILDGKYKPGSRISIEEVRAEFGVSKQPVMDAMRRLESIGIVQIVPQSGCRVESYTSWEVEDFFRLFGSFESEIAAAAAARRTPDQLDELDEAWRRIEELNTCTDSVERARRYRGLNREFHLVIHRMAHSRVMAEQSKRMWDMSDFLINTAGPPHPLADAIVDRNHDHDVIRTAIRQQRVEVARAAMGSHITGTIDHVKPVPGTSASAGPRHGESLTESI